MNFSEFKKLLGADPLNSEPEMRAARESGAQFAEAAAAAQAFEAKLQGALNVAVDEQELLDGVLTLPEHSRRGPLRWLAMAASVLIVVGVASMAWYQASQPKTMEEYLAKHFRYDGHELLDRSSAEFDSREVNELMARFNASVAPELVGMIDFIKVCPTMHGKGAHMIISSKNGPLSVIFMPDTELEEGVVLTFDDMEARVVSLGLGSAAIIGAPGQSDATTEDLLRKSITPLGADA